MREKIADILSYKISNILKMNKHINVNFYFNFFLGGGGLVGRVRYVHFDDVENHALSCFRSAFNR